MSDSPDSRDQDPQDQATKPKSNVRPAGRRTKFPVWFFGRIRTFDIACPSCGDVFTTRAPRSRTKAPRTQNWDTRAQVFTCPNCLRAFCLGILAWPIVSGRPPCPPDAIPTISQAETLRALTSSLLAPARRLKRDAANRVVPDTPPPDSVWRGLPEGVSLEDFLNGRWKPS